MKMIYWASTALVSLLLVISAYTYLYVESTIQGIKALGFPDFFRLQLAALKILAAIVLLFPQVPLPAKEWAYAGVGLFLLTAVIAHTANRDPVGISIINGLFFLILATSNIALQRVSVH